MGKLNEKSMQKNQQNKLIESCCTEGPRAIPITLV